jgi:hypothetical protein
VAWAYPGPRAFFLSSHRVSWCAAVSPCIAGPGELGDRERHVPGRPLDGRAEQGGQQQAVPIVFLADDQQVGTDVAFEGGCGGGLISTASPSQASTTGWGSGHWPGRAANAAAAGWDEKSAGASGSKVSGGGYSRPPASARMVVIHSRRLRVGSAAILMTGLGPSPRRSL